ncbi:MAG: hypothetical protein HQL31_11515, partial [Planctomycetes bacterium]|nr:hypothetical protein [Planctomycetota bacterium]
RAAELIAPIGGAESVKALISLASTGKIPDRPQRILIRLIADQINSSPSAFQAITALTEDQKFGAWTVQMLCRTQTLKRAQALLKKIRAKELAKEKPNKNILNTINKAIPPEQALK